MSKEREGGESKRQRDFYGKKQTNRGFPFLLHPALNLLTKISAFISEGSCFVFSYEANPLGFFSFLDSYNHMSHMFSSCARLS